MNIETWKRELRKGTGEISVLYALHFGEIHGDALVASVRALGFPDVAHGSIYQMMRRLKKAEFVTSTIETRYDGDYDYERPLRNYYRLTPKGAEALRAAIAEFRMLAHSILPRADRSLLESPDERIARTRRQRREAWKLKREAAKRFGPPPSPSSPRTSDDPPPR